MHTVPLSGVVRVTTQPSQTQRRLLRTHQIHPTVLGQPTINEHKFRVRSCSRRDGLRVVAM